MGLSVILGASQRAPGVDKEWRLITSLAVFGLVVAALILLYLNVVGEFDPTLYTGFAIVCPPFSSVHSLQ